MDNSERRSLSLEEVSEKLQDEGILTEQIDELKQRLVELRENAPETLSDREAGQIVLALMRRINELQAEDIYDAQAEDSEYIRDNHYIEDEAAAGPSTGYLDVVGFLRIIFTNLWIIILVGALGTAAAYVVIEQQTSIYEASASLTVLPTYADIPRPIEDLDVALGTYVQVLRSQSLEHSVERTLEPLYSAEDLADVETEIRPVENSSVIFVFARSSDPELAQAYANEMANQMVDENPLPLFEVAYQVAILDAPELPEDPVYPDKRLSLTLGALGSLAVGLMLAFLWDTYFKSRRSRAA